MIRPSEHGNNPPSEEHTFETEFKTILEFLARTEENMMTAAQDFKKTRIQRLHGLQQEISMLDVKIENSITGAERVGKSQMQTKKEMGKISPESLRKMDDLLIQRIKNMRETKKQIIQALEDVTKILDQQYAKLGTFLDTYAQQK
jgi:hypothetical protein